MLRERLLRPDSGRITSWARGVKDPSVVSSEDKAVAGGICGVELARRLIVGVVTVVRLSIRVEPVEEEPGRTLDHGLGHSAHGSPKQTHCRNPFRRRCRSFCRHDDGAMDCWRY